MASMPILDMWVAGIPEPQGSKTVGRTKTGKAFVREDNPDLLPWRSTVTATAQTMTTERGVLGALRLQALFVFPRLRSHFGKRGLLASAPAYPAVRPDLDKLCRAIIDGLGDAGVMRQDSQICQIDTTKIYADMPGVRITLSHFPALALPGLLQLIPLNGNPQPGERSMHLDDTSHKVGCCD